MLPGDFPKWRTVHAYFQIWSEKKDGQESILEQALKKLAEKYRSIHGRNEKASFCIIDAQSVKNTDSAEEKGYDAGKKVSGIKRHIGVDILGLPLAIHITTADRNDRTGATEMLELQSQYGKGHSRACGRGVSWQTFCTAGKEDYWGGCTSSAAQ